MIFDRSPFIVEMDAMNSFNVDLLPSAMVALVDPAGDLLMGCRSGFRVWMWSLCSFCRENDLENVLFGSF